MKKFLSILTLLFLLFAQPINATVPEAIKYQAIVRDNSGNILTNRNVSIRLSILKNNISGPIAYAETHAITTNTLGLINVEIGKGVAVNGVFSAITWNDADYFIKIEVDENGGSNYNLAGVSQLVSVPYSLYAKKAGNGTQWSDTSNNIYFRTGNVGIGTNNPKSSLEIKSSDRRGSQILITGDSPVFRFGDTTYSNNGVTIGVAADSNDLIPRSGQGDLVFTNEAYGTGGGYIFGTDVPSQACVKITDDCKVGIGTDAPVSKLDVKGGDVNIEDIGSGVIMKSPDGQCWRMTVSDIGQPVITSINCLTGITINNQSNSFGAVASYPFNGNANDITGNSFNGTISNATLATDRKGNANSAFSFSSTSGSYIQLPTYQSILGSSNEFSLSIWLKFSGVDAGPTPFQLFPDNPNDRLLVSVPYHPTANPADVYWDYGSISSGVGRLNIPITTFTNWKHFVFTKSQSQSKMEIYIDGILSGSKSNNSILIDKNRNFRIGGGGLGTETFNGEIDDVKIFNRSLNSNEVLQIYNAEK